MKILPTLHILNGDASVPAFKVANLPGQMLVWREILASGPAVGTIPEADFWKMREQFITQNFDVAASDFQEKLLPELYKLENAQAFFEVVLWFDTDLVCQINLLYLLHKLHQQKPSVVSVCISESKPIGHKSLDEMQWLFEHRHTLELPDLKQASELWQLYAGPDPAALQDYLQRHQVYSDHLMQAFTLHLQRFPSKKSGLGEHQKLLLKALTEEEKSVVEVYKQFWENDPGYGFGDWQLQTLLNELSPDLVSLTQEKASITVKGKLVLEGKIKFEKQLNYWLGGVQIQQQKPTWQRDEETGQIEFSKNT